MVIIIWLLGYKSQQDIPLLSENCGYGGYFEYIGYMVKKESNVFRLSGYQSNQDIPL